MDPINKENTLKKVMVLGAIAVVMVSLVAVNNQGNMQQASGLRSQTTQNTLILEKQTNGGDSGCWYTCYYDNGSYYGQKFHDFCVDSFTFSEGGSGQTRTCYSASSLVGNNLQNLK